MDNLVSYAFPLELKKIITATFCPLRTALKCGNIMKRLKDRMVKFAFCDKYTGCPGKPFRSYLHRQSGY